MQPHASVRTSMPPGDRLIATAEALTVGLPFGFFKLAVGLHVMRTSPSWSLAGQLLVGLASLDVVLNVANSLGLALAGRRIGPICVLHGMVRRVARPGAAFEELGLALDAALAFCLVAAMVALGELGQLPSSWRSAWNVAVVFNVLGAGLLRLAKALERAAEERRRSA